MGIWAAGAQLYDYYQSGKYDALLVPLAFIAIAIGLTVGIGYLRRDRKSGVTQRIAERIILGSTLVSTLALVLLGLTAIITPSAAGSRADGGGQAASIPSASVSMPAPSTSVAPCAAAPKVVVDNFDDGRVDHCKWHVADTVSSTYREQGDIRVSEREGQLIFDVPPRPDQGGEIEIFALPKGHSVAEVSIDITLLSVIDVSGGVGVIANLGDADGRAGPLISLDGGPGSNGAGHDISWCSTGKTDYDDCDHPEPCDSLKLRIDDRVRLRIVKAADGYDSYIGNQPCGRFKISADIASVNLNLYADKGSGFRIAVDNFYMRFQ